MTEQKKKELKKAPKNKAKKSIKIFNKMAKNITFPRPTNKTAEWSWLVTKGLVMNKKIFIQILKTILFSVIGGVLGSLITFYFMNR